MLRKFQRATWSLSGIVLEAIYVRVDQTLNLFILCLETTHEDELKSSGLVCLIEEISRHYIYPLYLIRFTAKI